jgi:hypothetical protein
MFCALKVCNTVGLIGSQGTYCRVKGSWQATSFVHSQQHSFLQEATAHVTNGHNRHSTLILEELSVVNTINSDTLILPIAAHLTRFHTQLLPAVPAAAAAL